MSKFIELLEQVKLLAIELEQYEDIELKLDMLEGETDYQGWLEWLYDKFKKEQAFENNVKERIEALNTRKQAAQNRQKRWKDMMNSIRLAMGEDKVSMPEFTISHKKGSYSVNVLDEDKIPEQFFKVIKNVDKTALKKALADQEVEGAELIQGEDSYIVRSK